MAIFIGIKETAGDYELKDKKTGEMKSGTYHNFMFSYIDEAAITANTVDTTKYECKVVAEKIKADIIDNVFGFHVENLDQLRTWVMCPIEVYYDSTGKLAFVRKAGERVTADELV